MEENKRPRTWISWLLFIVTVVVVFFLGLLASSIVERRAEKEFVYKPTVKIDKLESRNEVWGINFPLEFTSYYETADTSFKSKYNGNAMIDMLAVDPRLVILWAGYGFAKDYNQGRGHYYALKDVRNSLRTGGPTSETDGPMPATCWTCKSPDVPRLMANIGVEEYYKGKWAGKGTEIVNLIGCANCHNAETMALEIKQPALIEAYERQGKNILDATHQEMRSLVCAQCHVEYYFNPKKVEGAAYLTFPWDKGQTVEDMETYYDSIAFSDWTHALSKAPMLKAQHPDFEIYKFGIHAERGVSCADCHMPYNTVGGQKFTDHHIQSPLNNISNSCQVCHREEAEELAKNVYDRQDKIIEIRDELEILLVKAHVEAKTAWDLGAVETQMKDILQDIRKAQWRWDYAAAGHGSAFHAPVEMGRVIGNGIVYAQEARLKLARVLAELNNNKEIEYPDISTKEKAQKYIGLDMDKLRAEKKTFLENLLPIWLKTAKEREDANKVVYF